MKKYLGLLLGGCLLAGCGGVGAPGAVEDGWWAFGAAEWAALPYAAAVLPGVALGADLPAAVVAPLA